MPLAWVVTEQESFPDQPLNIYLYSLDINAEKKSFS